MTPEAAFGRVLDRLPCPAAGTGLGVAVSGGGDSLALLLLAAQLAPPVGWQVRAVTVDHGLRPEAADEAALVAALCGELDVSHDILRWKGWDGRGNLQDAARRARQRLIGDWAAGHGIATVLTGHTRDDQAETVLLRLARGSGVDGLAGIAPVRRIAGVTWVRPLLDVGRAELRRWLAERDVRWIDDPSNADERFDRVRARRLLAELGDLGLSAGRLAATAARMRRAADALAAGTAELAARAVTQDRGDLLIDRSALFEAPEDLAMRLLAAALCWVSGNPYRPRHAALTGLMEDLAAGKGGTLHGALARVSDGTIRVAREARAVAGQTACPGQLWDGRWIVTGPARPGDSVRALGSAVSEVPDWRDAGLPRESLAASPAVWREGAVIAAPLAGLGQGWRAELAEDRDDFACESFSH